MNIKITSIKDLDNMIGKALSRELCARVTQSGNTQKKPKVVDVHDSKPPFFLNDGETLTFYSVDLVDQKITGESYGGSGDTTMHHAQAQLSSGQTTERDAVLAVTKYWNGSNMSWTLDIISSNIVRQLTVKGS